MIVANISVVAETHILIDCLCYVVLDNQKFPTGPYRGFGKCNAFWYDQAITGILIYKWIFSNACKYVFLRDPERPECIAFALTAVSSRLIAFVSCTFLFCFVLLSGSHTRVCS